MSKIIWVGNFIGLKKFGSEICFGQILFWFYNIVKTQLNHNQVEVGLTHPPPKLCVVVVQLSSNQQHNRDKSDKTKIEFGQTKFPTQIFGP